MKIELSDEQEQAIQQGRPVEVRDPASGRAVVVVARELFERVRSLLEPSSVQATGVAVSSAAAPASGEATAVRVRLRDLPTPPEVAAEADRWCRKYAWGQRGVEEQLKLQYYYGGQAIYVLRTPEGAVVIPIEERFRDTPDLRSVLLTPDERPQAVLDCPTPWHDTVSQILSPSHHES